MVWLSTQEVSELEGVSERTIRRNIENYNYDHANGIGGRSGVQYKISLNSLSQKAQDKYNNVQEEKIYEQLQSYTGKQREEADFKAFIVKQYQESKLSPEKYIAEFNAKNPNDTITKSQLFRWQKKWEDEGILGLIDKRGGSNRGQCNIAQDAWDYFYALYMTLQKRSIQRCWEYTKREYPSIPSVSTFERKVNQIPNLVILYYREGQKAFNDALPSMERARYDIQSNDIWFSDHHLMDVAVKNKRGKVVRPWLTVFYDARSNKVISYILRDKDPDATVVKQCLRIGMEKYGIPKEVYFDNGKDYREKSFSRDFPISLVNQLGIGTIYANPYHGQAKTVERFFGTLTSRFCKFIPTYLGKDAKQRPENMRVTFDKLESIAPTIEEFEELLKGYIEEYNNTNSTGADMENKCPDCVYYENLTEKKVVEDKSILRLLCGTFEERTILANGIQFQNRLYYHSEFLKHKDEKVIINYDPYNVDELNVFDCDMRAICIAPAKVRTPFRHTTQEEIREAKKEIKKAKKMIQDYAPVRELDTMQIISKNQFKEKQYAENPETKVISGINPKMSNNQQILEASLKSRRNNDEESVGAMLLKKYELEKQVIGG